MKGFETAGHGFSWLAVGLAALVSLATPLGFAAEEKNASSSFIEKMKKWQDEVSEQFSKAMRDLRRDHKALDQSVAMISVDLREGQESYILRLSLPGRNLEEVEVKLVNRGLSIVVPAEGTATRYEQTLVLADVEADSTLEIEKRPKDGLIIVTVPKSLKATGKSREPKVPESSLETLDRSVLEGIDRMRREMDRVFKEAAEELRLEPAHWGFFDESRFGSSVVLEERDDEYVVRAYLPMRDSKNLNVTVEGQILKIEEKAEKSDAKKFDGEVSSYQASFSQLLTLPGPVIGDQMKVDHKEGMVVVTLPKATSGR